MMQFGLTQSPAYKQCNAGHYTGTEKGQRDKNLVVMEWSSRLCCQRDKSVFGTNWPNQIFKKSMWYVCDMRNMWCDVNYQLYLVPLSFCKNTAIKKVIRLISAALLRLTRQIGQKWGLSRGAGVNTTTIPGLSVVHVLHKLHKHLSKTTTVLVVGQSWLNVQMFRINIPGQCSLGWGTIYWTFTTITWLGGK